MKPEPLAWVLNLDAEHELEARGAYTPTKEMIEIVARARAALPGGLPGGLPDGLPDGLVGRADVIAGDQPAAARGLRGIAWCPTPGALALLHRVGARVPRAPSLEVLREVNARPFSAGLDPRKTVAASVEEALRCLAAPAPHGWLVRRTYGAAGRGRRRLDAGRLAEDDRAWIDAGLRRGPLVIEPWVQVTLEVVRHGIVHAGGDVEIGPPCVQETTRQGAWCRSRLACAGELSRAEDEALERSATDAGLALARAGYFGPFGVDAFRHERHDGALFQPLSEVNARFTMGWHVGMGSPGRLAGPFGRLARVDYWLG